MTTGRINQVTILNPSASPGEFAPGSPPRGAELVTRVGTRRSGPSRAGHQRETRATPKGYPCAPTEFPKGRSAAGQSGPKTTVPGRMRPSGGGVPPPVNAGGRILAATSPQRRRGAVARGQPSTDTRNVPAGRGPAGLRSPAAGALRCQINGLTRAHPQRGSLRPQWAS